MPDPVRKLSDALKEMARRSLRDPRRLPSADAIQLALILANVAWNECVGLGRPRDGYGNLLGPIESRKPSVWNEFRSNDINALIDGLVQYKQTHFADDRRRILTCGMIDDKVRVEWMQPAAPGVDSRWEIQLHTLVRLGKRDQAIRFIRETRNLPRKEAEKLVKKIVTDLGLGSVKPSSKPRRKRATGGASERLHARLSEGGTDDLPTGEVPPYPGAPGIPKLIQEGIDPIHAAYIFVQHITAKFAEVASRLPEMKKYAQIVGKAEDEYLPSGPPMSPLTTSFFTTWAFYDLQFDGDRHAGLLLDRVERRGGHEPSSTGCLEEDGRLPDGHLRACRHGRPVRPAARTLTNAEFACHSASGYRGRKGELWYVRLLPPLEPELASYYIVFTTPYILMASKEDCVQFLRERCRSRTRKVCTDC